MYTKNFKELNKEDVNIAGGKGASLGEMTQAKIPVPGGFVILAHTFDLFLEKTDLNVEIDAIISKVNHQDVNSINVASEVIADLIRDKEVPQEVVVEVFKEFKDLNSLYVAVRSSATAEDSSSASWAGELETYLNTTKEDLLTNIKKCWASLFTPRAIFYRFEKKLHDKTVSVAVVIQKMIQSEISGITFTVHPITEDRNQMIIEAGYGLGEAIVGGKITPDTYIVDKENYQIQDINISRQEMMMIKTRNRGIEEIKVEEEEQRKQKILPVEKVIELAKLCHKIEKHYQFPCDIEWALEKNIFYIIQSRPITTLSD